MSKQPKEVSTMDDQPQENPEDTGPEHVEPSPEVDVPEGTKDSGRFSAYDKTYLKYVGGVHDTKAKAEKAAKAAGVTDFDVVEV